LTPRTTFRVTLGEVPSPFAAPAALDTGITPIPPLKLARDSSPAAAKEQPIPRIAATIEPSTIDSDIRTSA
jgi:hypothetical protein